MLWIIWTIGWFITCVISDFLYEKMYHSFNTKKYEPGRTFIFVLTFILWMIGIIKFW